MALRDWSTTAANNNQAAPNGAPEGMAPSGVNNSMREIMAQVRGWYEAPGWTDLGHAPTRVDNDTFTVATDLTATYVVGRRLKFTGGATSYGTVSSSSYSAPNTTVNVTMDSGNLPNPLTTVALGYDSTTGAVQPYFRITPAEIAAGVTPVSFQYEPGVVNRYGTNTTPGTTNMGAAINAALSCNQTVYFLHEDYAASLISGSQDNQRIFAKGDSRIIKNANGVLFTHSGDQLEINGVQFRGDASTPTFTGHNIVLSGENPRLINVGSRWAYGRALKSTGNGLQVVGTSDIYQSALQDSATEYDIEVGVSGTATLYHRLSGFTTSQSTGGVHFIDTGSHVLQGCQIGKLFIDAGTSPAGVNGGIAIGNRILGDITTELANAVIVGNQLGTIAVTFGAGVSGHVFLNNTMPAGATITNNGGESLIVRDVSSGSGTALKFGPDSSAAILTIDPTSPGRFNFTAIGLPNNVTQTFRNVAGSGNAGSIGANSSDNVQLLSAAALQLLSTASGGSVQIGANSAVGLQVDNSSTAGQTRFLVYDVDNATLERVTVGAADSGGAGFKVLRIPN